MFLSERLDARGVGGRVADCLDRRYGGVAQIEEQPIILPQPICEVRSRAPPLFHSTRDTSQDASLRQLPPFLVLEHALAAQMRPPLYDEISKW